MQSILVILLFDRSSKHDGLGGIVPMSEILS